MSGRKRKPNVLFSHNFANGQSSGIHLSDSRFDLRDHLGSLAFRGMELNGLETNVAYRIWRTEVNAVPRTVREVCTEV